MPMPIAGQAYPRTWSDEPGWERVMIKAGLPALGAGYRNTDQGETFGVERRCGLGNGANPGFRGRAGQYRCRGLGALATGQRRSRRRGPDRWMTSRRTMSPRMNSASDRAPSSQVRGVRKL